MALEKALGYEVGQNSLLETWRMTVHKPFGLSEYLSERPRNNQVAETKRREEHLGKSADVEHPFRSAEPLERRNRAAAESELTVVIVLHDVCARRLSPGEQLESSCQRHDCAGRELVRGRNVD